MNHQCNRFSVIGLGIGIGLTTAIFMFLAGVLAWLLTWGTDFIVVMGSLYAGYEPTLIGSLFGALYGFVDGFITGALVAAFYNLYVCHCRKKEVQQPTQPTNVAP